MKISEWAVLGFVAVVLAGVVIWATRPIIDRERILRPMGVLTAELEPTELYNLCNRLSFQMFIAGDTTEHRRLCIDEFKRLKPAMYQEYVEAWRRLGL